ncbi:MAG: MBL fold metallo-hydrolase [Infirmifilum sp.]
MAPVVEVQVISGEREVGGVCIAVRDRGETIVLDQGIRFSVFRRLYGYRIRPLGPVELRATGVLPPLEKLQEAKALYITHLHLDHLGLLGDLPYELEVRVPSTAMVELLGSWYRDSPDWMSYLPPGYATRLVEAEPMVTDANNVVALPVPHSAYPSTAYLYFGSDENVLYTGDLRLEHLSKTLGSAQQGNLFTYLEDNPDLRVDTLLVEGTNFGRPVAPLKGEDLRRVLREVVRLQAPLLVAVHRMELDLFLAVLEELVSANRVALVASARIIDLLEAWSHSLSIPMEWIRRPLTLAEKPSQVELAGPDELRSPGGYAVIADLFELVDFARSSEVELRGGHALLLTSEVEAEEGLEESLAVGWLRRLGLQPYRLRVSGHYYPHELPELLALLRPRRVIPVHTEAPDMLVELWRRVAG